MQSLDDWLNFNGSSSQYQNDTSRIVISNGQELINKLHVAGLTEERFTEFVVSIILYSLYQDTRTLFPFNPLQAMTNFDARPLVTAASPQYAKYYRVLAEIVGRYYVF